MYRRGMISRRADELAGDELKTWLPGYRAGEMRVWSWLAGLTGALLARIDC